MKILDILDKECIIPELRSKTKEEVLEELTGALLNCKANLDKEALVEVLLERERLGSTGIGQGIAIPHGRLAELPRPIGAMMVLRNGIEYDAIDGQPVLILFGLLVPESCNDVHLQILAGLAQMFSDESLRAALVGCQGADAIRTAMLSWGQPSAASA